MRLTFVLGAAILAGGGLAACSQTATPVIACTLPTGTQVALAYPAPGASGVPDSPGQIVIAATPALPNSWQIVLQYPNGSVGVEGVLNTISPSSIPTPFATPGFANPTYESGGLVGPIASGPTTISVLLNNQSSSCNGFPQIASFTTQ
jgi:hypothetical protein